MSPADITPLFTRSDGSYFFARWGRPIVPVVFGVEDETLSVVKGAFEALCALTGHKMAETDAESGTNVMVFFFREWSELTSIPDLDRLVEGLAEKLDVLDAQGANQYRSFRFDAEGAIQACFIFLRMDDALSRIPAEELALGQVTQAMVCWSDLAFQTRSPLAKAGQTVVLRPDIAAVLRAAYDPVMPATAQDDSHALRLFARVQACG
ncbi:hypothetical protein [Sagittula sp. SSi028]|uniref:hypothetical protein n=1 Tax=Sagittula sp. SSi028 TaxID=3400636 RepID=UPI003AF7159F